MNLLVKSAIDVAVVLLLAFAALPLLRRQSAALRHLVLSAALICAAVLPVVALWLPEWPVPLPVAPPSLSVTFDLAMGKAAAPVAGAQMADGLLASAPSTDWFALALWVWVAGAAVGLGTLSFGFARLSRLSASARTDRHRGVDRAGRNHSA